MAATMDEIRKLREETGAGVMDAKKALEESKGDMKAAKAWIAKKGLDRAEKKADREASNGVVYAYVHHNSRSGALVELACETDFVAKTEAFQNLAHEVALQACTEEFENVEALLNSEYIRDPSKKISDLIKEAVLKFGENIKINKIIRWQI